MSSALPCLAELACLWPHRAGGIPSYTTVSFEPLLGRTTARHLGARVAARRVRIRLREVDLAGVSSAG